METGLVKWPPLAPVPSSSIRNMLPPAEWETCLDSWIVLAQFRLRKWKELDPQSSLDTNDVSLVPFIDSYVEACSTASTEDPLRKGPKAMTLRTTCLSVIRHLLSSKSPPVEAFHWTLLANLLETYGRIPPLTQLLEQVWNHHGGAISQSLENVKASIAKQLSSTTIVPEEAAHRLNQLTNLVFVLPDIGHILMTGSDYIDSLDAAYKLQDDNLRKALVANTYMCLTSLMKTSHPKISLLLDHLFGLKTTADQSGSPISTVLADLVTNTSFPSRLSAFLRTTNHSRGSNLLEFLQTLKSQTAILRNRPPVRRKPKLNKGKSRPIDTSPSEAHAHNLSLIIQIQDLFPDLGQGYISHLLTFYSDGVETVTAHLLEGTLDPSLRSLDPKEPLPAPTHSPDLVPRPTPPLQPQRHISPLPERRNVFDNDDFDNLNISASHLHIGRANQSATADALLFKERSPAAKAAIYSALAAFDSDDDERDDTYDVADVGGTVDSAAQDSEANLRDRRGGAGGPATSSNTDSEPDATEPVLFAAYQANPTLFARDAQTRRSQGREKLKQQLGPSITDEAIEGFAVMLQRDPKRLRRLEARYGDFGAAAGAGGMQQNVLASTAYRKSATGGGQGEEETGIGTGTGTGTGTGGDGAGNRGARDGNRGRNGGVGIIGRGGRRGGRDAAGSPGSAGPAGPAGDGETQRQRARARDRKEMRGNQRRREGRARKMARAGFPG